MALVKEYFELTKKYQTLYGDKSVVLMQVGSFLEIYGLQCKKTNIISGSAIEDIARICDLNIANKKSVLDDYDVLMAGFIVPIVEKYLKKLNDFGYTCMLFTQDENVKNTTRSLQGIYSPGTTFVNTDKLSNNIMCIWVECIEGALLKTQKMVCCGISVVNILTGSAHVSEYNEKIISKKNKEIYNELEHLLSIYNPNELIFISNSGIQEINDILNYTNGSKCPCIHKIPLHGGSECAEDNEMTIRAKNCEKQKFQKTLLERFYSNTEKEVDIVHSFCEKVVVLQSFVFLLDFVHSHNPNLIKKIGLPHFGRNHNDVILANHSLKQLNIIDDGHGTQVGRYSSVAVLLNQCQSSMGKRLLNDQIHNPTTNILWLEQEYNITGFLLKSDFKNAYSKVSFCLKEIKDLSKFIRMIFLKKISPKHFSQLYHSLNYIKELFCDIPQEKKSPKSSLSADLTHLFDYLNQKIPNFSKIGDFIQDIKTVIESYLVMDIAKNIDNTELFEELFIKKGVCVELDEKMELLSDSIDILNAIRSFYNGVLAKYEKKSGGGAEYVKIHETEKNSFSLVATQRRCTLLKEKVANIAETEIIYYSSYTNKEKKYTYNVDFSVEMQGKSSCNGVIYNTQIQELCKNVNTIKMQLKDVLLSVYCGFLSVMEQFQEQFETMIDFIALIDVVYNKANLAHSFHYTQPLLALSNETKSFVQAFGLRHALIEHLNKDELYVGNDISLGSADDTDGILLYGTNMIGKTSLIRALGIAVVMAQSGFYVPATRFVFKPFDSIYTRILGNDNLFKGDSTFSTEMRELNTILSQATENSLVLGDELCSGTENTSAISLFVSGVQYLHKKRCSFIFATHLHEIVGFDEIKNLSRLSIKHMSVIYDREQDTLIYDRKLRDGSGNSMYGLEVCKSLHLPLDFLENANELRIKYFSKTSSLLSMKTSHFNSKKIVGICEMCGANMGTEVHHLQHQSTADDNGIIRDGDFTFHKNHTANLLTVCEKCHTQFHSLKEQHKKVRTTKGIKIISDTKKKIITRKKTP
jgi:DNA mismatch repair protein MutS